MITKSIKDPKENNFKPSRSQPIAIVGMGLVFPAGDKPVHNAQTAKDAFWQAIVNSQSLASPPPPGRWILPPEISYAPYQRDAHGNKKPVPDHIHGPHACFVNEKDLEQTELDKAGLRTQTFAFHQLDPVYQLPLYALARCLEDAGMAVPDLKSAVTGLIMGNIALPTDGISTYAQDRIDKTHQTDNRNLFVTGLPASLAARAAGLNGPCHTLDAACASSLYALKYACDLLHDGQADVMFAGGLSRPDSLYTQMGFSQLTALSASGQCRPFDQDADGLLVGEGCGLFMLKRLEDAKRSKDRIYACIHGCGLSSDIEGSLFAPASEGQLRAMKQAYEASGWDPSEVDLIECHGTGTPKGDQTELSSLHMLWQEKKPANNRKCVIGSVKSNIGHLLTGAGAAGLAKILLAMTHETLPPTANFTSPNAKHNLSDSPFEVLNTPQPWSGHQRKAAISAFGFGGINAHLLLQQPPMTATAATQPNHLQDRIAIVAADYQQHDRQTPIEIPAGQFPIPPLELLDASNQQKIMLLSADAIMQSRSKITLDFDRARLRMGCLIGIAQDLGVTRFHLRWREFAKGGDLDQQSKPLSANSVMGNLGAITASRIARSYKIGGPAFTLSSEETSGHKALATACQWLRQGDIDEALVGACHTFEPFNQNAGHLSDDQSTAIAVSFLVMRESDASRQGYPILGFLDQLKSGMTTANRSFVDDEFGAATSLVRLYEKVTQQRQVSTIELHCQERGGGFDQSTNSKTDANTTQPTSEMTMPIPSVPTETSIDQSSDIIQQYTRSEIAQLQAQQSFLAFQKYQQSCMQQLANKTISVPARAPQHQTQDKLGILDYQGCMTYAVGRIADALDQRYAPIDQYPTRVRLPDEPLMLAHRILETQGPPAALADLKVDPTQIAGRVVTEHDIHPGSWYLDHGKMPTCIAVEAGQADLYLSGFLGIDFRTKGLAVYRLLDAIVTFHAPLPEANQTIHYDICIKHFFTQGDTHLFRFEFDATVNGQLVLTMREGCAGFFTQAELNAGQGIVLTSLEKKKEPGKTTENFTWLAPRPDTYETYSEAALDLLRTGNIEVAFGSSFRLPIKNPVRLPGVPGSCEPGSQSHQTPSMTLVHRILNLSPTGGRFGLGQITGEADIHPDDWFLTCHFVDDQVMPGTLMYECCLHTLRVLMLRMGWVCEDDQVAYEPIPGIPGQLKCRGQVTEQTRTVQYEITVKEIGYRTFEDLADEKTPYVIADALMYADHRPVVQMKNMSLRLSGQSKARLEAIWQNAKQEQRSDVIPPANESLVLKENPKRHIAGDKFDRQPPLYTYGRIHAYANTNPSDGFGAPYRIFDLDEENNPRKRVLARLPRAPYQLIDRIVAIENATPFNLEAGARITAQYDVAPVGSTPAEATAAGNYEQSWFYLGNRQLQMPFAFLLEIALQPCGWLAAYLGSALTCDMDIRFRNLGGQATLSAPLPDDLGTLTTQVTMTRISQSAGMIIQNFDMHMTAIDASGQRYDVYQGDTYFGFFSKEALENQVGLRDVQRPRIEDEAAADISTTRSNWLPNHAPMPDDQMRMLDRVSFFAPEGGEKKLGFIQGKAAVNPDNWFFKAHFFQDPVWPGSLGLESFQQLLKVIALYHWYPDALENKRTDIQFESMTLGQCHQWTYRGQILPTDREVTVEAIVTEVNHQKQSVTADGLLIVDGRIIYEMKDFGIRIASK